MASRIERSVCPYDCPDTCGLLVEIHNDTVLKVRGDPQHGYSQGTLCPKVNGYEKTVHSQKRLTSPLIRVGPKGSGQFKPVSWNEAISTIAARWTSIIAAYGGESILPCSYAGTMGLVQRNSGHALFHRLGASRLDRTICSPALDDGYQSVYGTTPGLDPDQAMESDLLILWGSNALATNIHFLPRLKEAQRRGAKTWLIDTYKTATAPLVDRSIVVRPGSDGALALAMLHVLEKEDLVDRQFLQSNVVGWEQLSNEVLPSHTPEFASRVTGVSLKEIYEVALAYGKARAPFIRFGNGLSRYGNGSMTVRCISCLPAAVGAWNKPGGGLLAGISTGEAYDLSFLRREDWQPKPTRLVNLNQIGHALTELTGPKVMSMYVYSCNPAVVVPDQNAVLAGLARDDLFTVVHERFMTDTARWADVVLPATTMVEHSDLYRSYGHYYTQRAKALIAPVGEAKSNWDVFRMLAKAMNIDDALFDLMSDQIIDAMLAEPSPWREGIDVAALNDGRPVKLNPPDARWQTPSGKIEIENRLLPHALPHYVPPYEANSVYPLRLQTAPSLYSLNSSFQERDELVAKQPKMTIKLAPSEATARGIAHGERVVAFNALGEVDFYLEVSDDIPLGVAVAEGVYWLAHAPGKRGVNALTSQRLTDRAQGSTFYDNSVEVKKAG